MPALDEMQGMREGREAEARPEENSMTPRELATELRSRINPEYAAQIGTESYERRLCAEALEAQADEIERLQHTPADKREDLRCVIGDLCAQVRERDAEISALKAQSEPVASVPQLTEQDRRGIFWDMTGKIATSSTTEYYAFCQGLIFSEAQLRQVQAERDAYRDTIQSAEKQVTLLREALQECLDFPVDYTDRATVREALAAPQPSQPKPCGECDGTGEVMIGESWAACPFCRMDRMALPSEAKDAARIGWIATHLKTGNEYIVTGERINATNVPVQPGALMVDYERDGQKFSREAGEFQEKFAAKGGT